MFQARKEVKGGKYIQSWSRMCQHWKSAFHLLGTHLKKIFNFFLPNRFVENGDQKASLKKFFQFFIYLVKIIFKKKKWEHCLLKSKSGKAEDPGVCN